MYKYRSYKRVSVWNVTGHVFEVIGMLVVACAFVWVLMIGFQKSLNNRCDYYVNNLTLTQEMERVCQK